jgi:radical SAM protein with 4Fe4S-binding SPASM domain
MPEINTDVTAPRRFGIRVKSTLRSALGGIFKYAWPVVPRILFLGRKPRFLALALTRKCNANCVFCAYQFATTAERAHMPTDMVDRLLQEIERTGVDRVMLAANIGEPTIAPDFIAKLKRLRKAGIRHIEMTSNALYWHKIGIEKLLADGPDVINISFAGFDKEMYERTFRVSHYEQTRDNILSFLRANKASAKPRIVNFRLRGDLPLEEMMAKPEMVEVKRLANSVSALTEVDDWLGLIKRENLTPGYKLQTEKPALANRPCRQLFDLTVHPDGDIHLCSCRNVSGDPDMHIGNLRDMSLADAHKKIPTVLSNWEQGKPPKSCQTCSMYMDPAGGLAGRVRQVWTKDATLLA